ncbi:hypothetical protein CTAM01_02248 [Colletotrichum tamarilloi]|uniref:Uncharacterized protein n=1 Tax=Colletotrichum tamarilloi TaxID=1209934 RepID=A0ABQ9RN92_9PEZI|nr:uncharacterized protein CTAM01_02248 [Colletotrichum tamarilloi]KAK1508462.1 hypothetical protein CTAM01_02248 [Colletotrichum tamarilloi]
MMLDEGTAGIVRNPAKKTKNRYLEFEVYDREDTLWGFYYNPKKFKDPAIVSEDFLKIVTLPASGSFTKVNKPTPVAKADESIEMPVEHLLVTFFDSCKIRNDDLDLAGKIESTMPSPYSVNHYEYMKSFLKKHKGKWAIYPIAKMEKPDPSDDPSWHAWAEQAMIALYDAYHPGMRDMSWEGFNNPVTCLPGQVASIFTKIAASVTKLEAFSSFARPRFKASPGPESGLNWNSPVLELYRVANRLWTGPERIRHEDGPSCWLYNGTPCRVEDNGNVKDLDRLAVTFCTRPMPEGVRGTKETIQRLRLPLRKNDGGEWKVKDGDYVIPAVEIAIFFTARSLKIHEGLKVFTPENTPEKEESDRPRLLSGKEKRELPDGRSGFETRWYSTSITTWQQPFVIKEKSTSQASEAGQTEKAGDGNVKCKEPRRFVYDSTAALNPEEDI